MPFITLILHAFMALAIDIDSPDPSRNRYLVVIEALCWNIGVEGLLQPIAALIVALIVCPIISFTILTGECPIQQYNVIYYYFFSNYINFKTLKYISVAVVRYWIRVVWDTAMFHMVIKNRGRIPACDSFMVKRIAGPGMASNYYYQVSVCVP